MTNGQIQTFVVEYASDKPCMYLKRGERYDAFLPVDEQSGRIFAVVGDDGEFGLPANRFRLIKDSQRVLDGKTRYWMT